MVMIIDTPTLATLLARVGLETFLSELAYPTKRRALGLGVDAALIPELADPEDLFGYVLGRVAS
jgi:hypothetical protein